MPSDWQAEITNNPDNDYDLHIELLEGEVPRARIFCDSAGGLMLKIYRCQQETDIPVSWLLSIVEGARRDLS